MSMILLEPANTIPHLNMEIKRRTISLTGFSLITLDRPGSAGPPGDSNALRFACGPTWRDCGPELAWAGQTEKGRGRCAFPPSVVETRSGLVQVPNLARRHPEWLLARHKLHRILRHCLIPPVPAVPPPR